jgi:hypothetical protein
MIILIGGPDGSGKSTIAELLSQQLRDSGATTHRLHYRPNILFSKNGASVVEGEPGSNPHTLDHHGIVRSGMKLVATFLDNAALHVLDPRTARSDHVVIQERGWWDQAIDTHRYRLHPLSRHFIRFLGRCLPRPALVVVLSGPPKLIHSRKPELSVQEIARQSSAWTGAAQRIGKRSITLDIRETPEDTTRRILDALEIR